jgi:nucleoside-diphosphate-sugar epimerase
MRVAVTGASGFVGVPTLEALARQGAEVFALTRRRPDSPAPFRWIECDLLDKASARRAIELSRPDAIVHLAWYVEPGLFWASAANLAWVCASLGLAEAAAHCGVKRFVGVGTCFETVRGGEADGRPSAAVNSTLYGAAKDATRQILAAYCANASIEFAWARLFFLYGAHEKASRLVPSVSRRLARGEVAKYSWGRAIRDYMDVRDAGSGLATTALSNITGLVNIATGSPVTVAHLVEELGRLAGRPDLIELGALPDRENEPNEIAIEGELLSERTEFRPARNLREGLQQAFDYWKDLAQGGPFEGQDNR